MTLSNKEKRALLAAISFMYKMGENFVPLIKDGDKEENQRAWKEAKVIYKDLHARIKKTL